MDTDERRAWLEGYGLGASFLEGWPPDSIQAQLYRAATLAAPHDDAVDRLLEAHWREHGEPGQAPRPDACDARSSAGPALPSPYSQLHRAWSEAKTPPAVRIRRARLWVLVAQGHDTRALAQLLGVSATTIRRDLRQMGLRVA